MDNTLAALFSLEMLSSPAATAAQILSLNEKTEQYGLSLTPADTTALMQTRLEALTANGRIEVGSATIGKLIDAFYSSAYISQRDYVATLHELIDLFYYVKNETMDLISDDELIEFMKDCYENRCGGSLELLAGRELEKLAENLRFGIANYKDMSHEINFEGDWAAQQEQEAEEEQERDRWEELENE